MKCVKVSPCSLCVALKSQNNPGLVVCSDGSVTEPDMAASFCPDHKAPMVLFLDRVYGIEDQGFLLKMLEVGFLPDLRASAALDTVSERRRWSQ